MLSWIKTRTLASGATNAIIKFFTREHEWVSKLEGGKARFGITDYAQRALGDLVYVELPKVGETIKKGNVVGVVESVKGASDIFAPISGTIRSINEAVTSKPSLINKYAESEGKNVLVIFANHYFLLGWLCEVEMSQEAELKDLCQVEQYELFLKGHYSSSS